MKKFILCTILVTGLYSCQSEDPYGLFEEAEPVNSFTDREMENLETLREEWKSVADDYLISPAFKPYAAYNILLDSMSSGPVIRPEGTGNNLVPVDYAWIGERDYSHLGVVGNNWSGRALNSELIYAVRENRWFDILDAKGKLLFSYPSSDTLDDGRVIYFGTSFQLIDYEKLIGCFVLVRGFEGEPSVEFRIYDLKGKALTSWKKRLTKSGNLYYQSIDPYLGGYFQNFPDDNVVEFYDFDGQQLFRMDSCAFRHQLYFPSMGLYRFFDLRKRRSFLLNFELDTVEVPFNLSYTLIYDKAPQDSI